jgi:LacI family transcriptional regulator, gluconate utilization system Gnt-I transcriptional repressor
MPRRAPAAPAPLTRTRATGRVTLADVAAAAGVSPITVSRALRGQASVDAELAARVKAAADRLGYVPDPAARALASARSTQVAVLVPMLSNALFVDLIEAVQRTLWPAGYQSLIGITHYDPAEEEQLLRSYLLHRPAGLIVTGFDRSPAARRLIAQSGVPCVHVMELSGDAKACCVGFSQADAGEAVTRHLLQRGRTRIAFAAAQLDPRTLQRAEGWRRALRAANRYDANLEFLDPQPSSMTLGAQLFQRILQNQPGVDAIFFCNDDLAQGALLAALKLHIPVPRRVAVAGFNDLRGSDEMLPALTTVHTPRTEIGEQAARLLLALMRGDEPAQRQIDVGFELKVRQST